MATSWIGIRNGARAWRTPMETSERWSAATGRGAVRGLDAADAADLSGVAPGGRLRGPCSSPPVGGGAPGGSALVAPDAGGARGRSPRAPMWLGPGLYRGRGRGGAAGAGRGRTPPAPGEGRAGG